MRTIILFLLVLPALGFSQQKGRIEVLDPQAFEAKKIHLKGTLLDVRSVEDFETGFIQGAENLDWNGGEFKTTVKKLPRYQPVFIYCNAGDVSRNAAEWMLEEGFTTVILLEFGLNAWKNKGLKIVNLKGDVINPKDKKSTDSAYPRKD